MSDIWTETTTAWGGTVVEQADLCYHVETPAERAMRLSNALADLLSQAWSGTPADIPAALSTEIIDALAEYSYLLKYVGASRVPTHVPGGTP